MYANVVLPSPVDFPLQLSKIKKNILWNQQSNIFYKITVLEPLTVFVAEDLITRQNIVFTKYNPSYLALDLLSRQARVSNNDIPPYLSQDLLKSFADYDGSVYRENKVKIMAFLQQRIDTLIKIVEEKHYLKTVRKLELVNKEKEESEKKKISIQLVELLKKDIPEKYLDQVLSSKYQQSKIIKPVFVDNYAEEIENHEEKQRIKKKPTTKPKAQQPLPKNQPTLFQFNNKKKQGKE